MEKSTLDYRPIAATDAQPAPWPGESIVGALVSLVLMAFFLYARHRYLLNPPRSDDDYHRVTDMYSIQAICLLVAMVLLIMLAVFTCVYRRSLAVRLLCTLVCALSLAVIAFAKWR